jgi:hypothetical protein
VRIYRQIVLAVGVVLWPIAATAQGLPTREGTCAYTKIAQAMERLQSGGNGPSVRVRDRRSALPMGATKSRMRS